MNLIEQIKVNDVSIDGYQGTFYTESPEYLTVITDSDSKILQGIKSDGTSYIAVDLQVEGQIINSGIQQQIDSAIEDMREEVSQMLDSAEETLSFFEPQDNPEWLQVTTDSEGRIIEGINKNGEKVINANIPSSSSYKEITPLEGKKIIYNGDSFCESRLSGYAYNGGGYPYIISKITNSSYENYARSGKTLGAICNEIKYMTEDADLICLEGGINDWAENKDLGNYIEGDYTSEYDTTTISGALEDIFKKALNKWTGKPICFVIFHKVNNATTERNAGTAYQVHDRIVEICNKWSIPYYDAFLYSGLNGGIDALNNAFLNGGSYTHPDGWHPDEEGYKRYYVPQLIKLFESILPIDNN